MTLSSTSASGSGAHLHRPGLRLLQGRAPPLLLLLLLLHGLPLVVAVDGPLIVAVETTRRARPLRWRLTTVSSGGTDVRSSAGSTTRAAAAATAAADATTGVDAGGHD